MVCLTNKNQRKVGLDVKLFVAKILVFFKKKKKKFSPTKHTKKKWKIGLGITWLKFFFQFHDFPHNPNDPNLK